MQKKKGFLKFKKKKKGFLKCNSYPDLRYRGRGRWTRRPEPRPVGWIPRAPSSPVLGLGRSLSWHLPAGLAPAVFPLQGEGPPPPSRTWQLPSAPPVTSVVSIFLYCFLLFCKLETHPKG